MNATRYSAPACRRQRSAGSSLSSRAAARRSGPPSPPYATGMRSSRLAEDDGCLSAARRVTSRAIPAASRAAGSNSTKSVRAPGMASRTPRSRRFARLSASDTAVRFASPSDRPGNPKRSEFSETGVTSPLAAPLREDGKAGGGDFVTRRSTRTRRPRAPAPPPVDRDARRDGRVARPRRARIGGEQDDDENDPRRRVHEGQEGIGGSSEGARQVGALHPQHDHRDDEQHVEEDVGGDHVLEQVAVASGQHEDGRPERLRPERVRGDRSPVQPFEPPEEEAVPGHRERDARARENEPVHASEGGDHDRGGHRAGGRGPEHRRRRRRGDAVGRGVLDLAERKDVQVRDVRENVQGRHEKAPDQKRERERAARLFDLFPRERDVVPRRLREQRADHRRPQRDEKSRAPESPTVLGHRPPEVARAEGRALASEHETEDGQRDERRELREREDVLSRRPGPEPGRVGRRQQEDDADADGLGRGDGEGPYLRLRLGDRGPQDAEELGEGDGDRGDRARLNDEEHRPAEEETEQRTVRLAEEDVLAARLRHHRRELRTAERRDHREDSGDRPRGEKPPARPQQARALRGHDEDAGTDHRADDESRRVEPADAADELAAHVTFAGALGLTAWAWTPRAP